MAGSGVFFKRCGCRDPLTRKRLERTCPRLRERGHGTWTFHCSVTTMFGCRERVRRGGYATRRAAETARDELLERSRAQVASMYSTATKLLDRARDAGAVRPELTATDLLALASGAALTGADVAHAQRILRLLRTGSKRTRTAPSAN